MGVPEPSGDRDHHVGVDRGHWFLVLWPLAVLFHVAADDFAIASLDQVGLLQIVWIAAAIAMLVQPTALLAAMLAGLHLPIFVLKTPFVGNHEVILLLTNLIVLGSVALRPKRWTSAAFPALRWLVLIAYGAIAFSKLNRGFLDPAVSCAVEFGNEFGDWVGLTVSDWRGLSYLIIYGTLIVECSIPILLSIRRVRTWGVLLGVSFHFFLALEPVGHVWDFTSVLFPLFLLFLPAAILDDLDERVQALRARVGESRLGVGLLVLVLAQVVLRSVGVARWPLVWPVWFVVALYTLVMVWRRCAAHGFAGERVEARFPRLLWVVLVLPMLNALAPYAEVRTAAAFNMYSNLHVADGETNHLIVPGTLPLRDTTAVTIVSVDEGDPLDYYVGSDLALPVANVERWLQVYPDSTARVAIDGTEMPISEAVDEASGFVDWIAFKFGHRRAIDSGTARQCLRLWGPAN